MNSPSLSPALFQHFERTAPGIFPKTWIAVFCGSSSLVDKHYGELAARLGATLAACGFGLVYGGSHSGQMAKVASAVLAQRGFVIGVTPAAQKKVQWEKEPAAGVEGLVHAPGLEQRKRFMLTRANAVIVMPGGWGTLDEVVYALWRSSLPVGLLGPPAFFRPLKQFIESMKDEGFTSPAGTEVFEEETPLSLLCKLDQSALGSFQL